MGLAAAIALTVLFTRGPLNTGLTIPVFKEVLIPFGYAFPLVGMVVMIGSSPTP